MNTEKYYTPTIEEFHYGFEFEILTGYVEWKSFLFNLDSPINTINILQIIIDKPEMFRVKYLNKEDIESLGWVCEGGQMISDGMKLYIQNKFRLFHTNNTIISISDIISKNEVFRGTIKNKSELKVLMRQLGI